MSTPLWDASTAQSVLATYAPWMQTLLNDCMAAWVPLAAIQIIWAAAGAHLEGKPVSWTRTLGYPIAAIVFLSSYQTIMTEALQVFTDYGNTWSWTSVMEMKKQETEAASVWAKLVNGASAVTHLKETAFLKGLMLLSLFASSVIFYFLQVFQVCTIGVLYILGPVFVLCLGFAPTSKLTWKWFACWLEVASWPLIYRVLMAGIVAMGKRIQPQELDFTNPAAAGSTLQKLSVVVMTALMTLMVPVIARILIGGGLGAVIAGGGLAMMKKGAEVGASAVAGAVTGGAAAGAAGALEGAVKGMAGSMGVRGLQDSPSVAAGKADAVQARRDPAAAAAHADAVQSHRSPEAAAGFADGVQYHRSPQLAAQHQDAVKSHRRT